MKIVVKVPQNVPQYFFIFFRKSWPALVSADFPKSRNKISFHTVEKIAFGGGDTVLALERTLLYKNRGVKETSVFQVLTSLELYEGVLIPPLTFSEYRVIPSGAGGVIRRIYGETLNCKELSGSQNSFCGSANQKKRGR